MPVQKRQLIAIVTAEIEGREPLAELRRLGSEGDTLRVIAPAVTTSPLQHVMGDVDESRREAEVRLELALSNLHTAGIQATGEVGDADPVQAASDALRVAPADEILIFEHEDAQARWFENGLFERAQEALVPPLRMIKLHSGEVGGDRVVAVEEAGSGRADLDRNTVQISDTMPRFSRGDLAGILVGIFGTITVIVLAAIAASGPGSVSGWEGLAVGIAIAVGLINMAHVVAIALLESVHNRHRIARLVNTMTLIGTGAAIVATAAILVLA